MNIPKIIRPFGGVTGITMQPTGLDIGLGKSSITSMQRGATVSGSATIAISGVDLSRSIIVVDKPAAGVVYNQQPIITFASKSSLSTVKYDGAAVTSSSFYWTVLEFSKIKSLQSGLYSGTPSTGEAIVSISSIDPNKSLLFWSAGGNLDTGPYQWGSWLNPYSIIPSSTSIKMIPGGGAVATIKIAWFVVELL